MKESEAKLIESMADDYSNVLKEAKSMGCNKIKALYNIPLKNMEMIVQALEKQTPKKPSPIDYKKYIDVVKNAKFLRGGFWCPNCKHVVYSGCYCEDCGQKLDWSDEE